MKVKTEKKKKLHLEEGSIRTCILAKCIISPAKQKLEFY